MPSLCPTCGAPGRRVSAVTIQARVLPAALAPAGRDAQAEGDAASGWALCRSEECPTIYFRGDRTVGADSVDLLPFHKNAADPEQLVCFCFQHTVGSVWADAQEHGHSTIRAEIQAACGRGEDDCERTNPQGRCCLSNVGALAKAALAAQDGGEAEPEEARSGCGCGGSGDAAPARSPRPASPFVIVPSQAPERAEEGCGCGHGCGCEASP